MTDEEAREFERIAALTIKANEAVAKELRNGGGSHTCVVAVMDVFQPEIDRHRREVEELRSRLTEIMKSMEDRAGKATFRDTFERGQAMGLRIAATAIRNGLACAAVAAEVTV